MKPLSGSLEIDSSGLTRWKAAPPQLREIPQKPIKHKPVNIAGDEFVRLLRHLGEPYRTMVILIAATGLRIGELVDAPLVADETPQTT